MLLVGTETADADPAAAQAVRDILDALGRYETLAAQMQLLDEQDSHAAGQPAAATLAKDREATDLLKATLLPARHRASSTAIRG